MESKYQHIQNSNKSYYIFIQPESICFNSEKNFLIYTTVPEMDGHPPAKGD